MLVLNVMILVLGNPVKQDARTAAKEEGKRYILCGKMLGDALARVCEVHHGLFNSGTRSFGTTTGGTKENGAYNSEFKNAIVNNKNVLKIAAYDAFSTTTKAPSREELTYECCGDRGCTLSYLQTYCKVAKADV